MPHEGDVLPPPTWDFSFSGNNRLVAGAVLNDQASCVAACAANHMEAGFQQIERSLAVLFQPGDTIELRCVGDRTINGYYRDRNKLANDAYALNTNFGPPQNVYICLNPVLPELYARRADEFAYSRKGEGVNDHEVLYRRWLLIDVDPQRPAGISATDSQKQAAIDLATAVYVWLQDQLGSGCIVCADSGNGAHMLVRLPNVPADADSAWVCERLLQLLPDRFSNEQAKIDTATHNAARICTCYGTVKRKGSDISEQPHRLSHLVHVPDPLQAVDWQMQNAKMAQEGRDFRLCWLTGLHRIWYSQRCASKHFLWRIQAAEP